MLVERSGGEAPLDLYKGHLRTINDGNDEPPYIKASRGFFPALNDPVGWYIPTNNYDVEKQNHWILKIQPFVAGGYEATVIEQDLHELAELMDKPKKTGKREEGERKENDVISSLQRSKKKIRHLIKSMGCDRMLTLTKREKDSDNFWNLDQWAAAWKTFTRLCRKIGIDLNYVVVPEQHKKGNYHLHIAISGHINLKSIIRFWYISLGGRGNEKGANTPGNVDLSYKRNMSDYERRAKLAKYLSKYVDKQLGHVEFNKRRYWPSKHKLPSVIRIVLNSEDWMGAFFDTCAHLSLDEKEVINAMFQFPEHAGFWFSFDTKMAAEVPF